MAKRDNHYEAAFEALLRARQIPYVAVDETRRSLMGGGSLKSLDYIVSPVGMETSWLVDVKGRRFPSGRQRQFWKNWSTADDLNSMAHWETIFGGRFQALLVFAYQVMDDVSPLPAEQLFDYRQQLYGFVAIRLSHYVSQARSISARWNTFAMPAGRFRELAAPLDQFVLPTATAPPPHAATKVAG